MFYLIFLFALLSGASCELFSSSQGLKVLSVKHGKFVNELRLFIKNLENDLAYAKWKLKDFEKDQEMIKSDTESYISNPLHAFLLIKRFTNDSFLIKEKIVMSNARFNSQTSSLSLSKIDLQGAVEGLDRLQMAYDLKTEDFTAGIIDGDKYNVSLSAHDLYVIAVELFNGKRFSRSLEYLEEALIKAKESVEFIEVSEANILLVMAEVYQEIGNYEKAIQTIDKVLKLRPENMKDLIQKREDLQLKLREEKVIVPQTPKEKLELRLTRKVCNGDVHRSNAHLSELHCRYESKSAFSKIAPYKLEEQHLDPLIVIYHDIISDNDIKIVKQLATDKLYQSVVFSDTGELLISSNIRISEVAWFEDESHQVIERLSKRIEDITGLSMSSSENLQIQKYGIGGFYKSHYDFTANPEISAKRFLGGDRIATFLIYLNDVEKGGATSFPYLRTKVFPVKGSATFWYNLLPSGSPDYRTRHSGCPILVGSKWVANKWIHEFDQEWRRPCDLNFTSNSETQVINDYISLFGDTD